MVFDLNFSLVFLRLMGTFVEKCCWPLLFWCIHRHREAVGKFSQPAVGLITSCFFGAVFWEPLGRFFGFWAMLLKCRANVV